MQRLVDRGQNPSCILRGKVLRHDRQRTVETVRGAAVKILELRRPGDLVRSQVPGPDPDLAGVECNSKGLEIGERGGRLLGNASVRVFAVAFGFSHFHTAARQFYWLLQRRLRRLGHLSETFLRMQQRPRIRILPPLLLWSSLRRPLLIWPGGVRGRLTGQPLLRWHPRTIRRRSDASKQLRKKPPVVPFKASLGAEAAAGAVADCRRVPRWPCWPAKRTSPRR